MASVLILKQKLEMTAPNRYIRLVSSAFLVMLTVVAVLYSQWHSDASNRLENGSQIVQTARGQIEYQSIGEGSAALILHGTLGGYDQGMLTAHMINSPSLRFLAVSRPGYLRTPLSIGASLDDQVESYVALLDALQIKQAAVVATSGGGPYALAFARSHPERCWALVLVSANTDPTVGYAADTTASPSDPPDWLTRIVLSDFSSWIGTAVMKWQPEFVLNGMVGHAQAKAVLDDPFRKRLLAEFVESLALLGRRREGSVNDARQFRAAAHLTLANIDVPTLVLHGEDDAGVPLAQAEYVAQIVRNAQLIRIPNGTHLMTVTHADVIGTAIRQFLNAHKPDQPL